MNTLGVYFGPEAISIVETKGKSLLHNIQIPRKTISSEDLEEKVSPEIKLVAFFKDELRKNNITAGEAGIALSGNDLIIRTFEMPLIPHQELINNAINFEARKYMPFKMEELILDYQIYYDKNSRKNLVLLVGIKKETLDKYLAIFKQLNLKIISLEYAVFSIVRLLKLARVKQKGAVGIIDVDLQELDEANFTVLENDFPLFSRDIILKGSPAGPAGAEEVSGEMALEKLKNEIRISLDYYHRKFPARKIDKMLFISSKDYQSDLEAFMQEMALSSQFIDVTAYIGKPVAFSLGFLKAYSASLARLVKIESGVDLISAKTRQAKELITPSQIGLSLFKQFKDLRVEPLVFISAFLICLAAFLFGNYKKLPLQKEINAIIARRPPVSTVDPQAPYEQLSGRDSEYKNKLEALDKFIKQQLYLTSLLNSIPAAVPAGAWLTDFSFHKTEEGKAELVLLGMVYLADANKEFETVNKFLSNLKANPEFSEYFKDIDIISIDRGQFRDLTLAKFSISCKTQPARE